MPLMIDSNSSPAFNATRCQESWERSEMMDVIALIVARGGSKGIPRKNLRFVAGRPLIAWSIESALRSPTLSRVLVSTEDEEIAGVAREWGAEVPFMRPSELAGDTTPAIDVALHALHWLADREDRRPAYLMLLQPTSPLRTPEDIGEACRIADTSAAPAVVSVVRAPSHPFLCKRVTEKGLLEDFSSVPQVDLRRQVLPAAYALNGAIYLSRNRSLREYGTFLPAGTAAYVMPAERSLDVDTPWDLQVADLALRNRHAQ